MKGFGTTAKVAGAIAVAGLLAGCAGGATSSQEPVYYMAVGDCPAVDILPGAASLVVYENGGQNDPGRVRYQASILETARTCAAANGIVQISVGVAGRIAAGPRGGSGTGSATVQIAVVVDGSQVVSQQAFQVTAPLGAPNYGGSFNVVAENITFAIPTADQGVEIVVGFVQ